MNMSKYKIILFTTLFSLVIDQQCIFGQNCPYNRGFCIDTRCECIEGYWSLMDKSLPPEKQIYCNYEQTNLYFPLFLEFVLPSLGHLYVGKYFFAIIKLFFFVTSFGTGFYLYGDLQIPGLVTALINQFIPEKKLLEREDMKKVLFKQNKKTYTLDDDISIGKKIILVIFNCTFIIFWIFWAADIYFYYFKIYKDGNGVPFK